MKEYLPRSLSIYAVQYDGTNYAEVFDMLTELLLDGGLLIDREPSRWIGPVVDQVEVTGCVEIMTTANRSWTVLHKESWCVVTEDYVSVLSDAKFQAQYVEKS